MRRIRLFVQKYVVNCLLLLAIFAVAVGIVYPLVMTGFAQVAYKQKANGSMVKQNGKPVGSSLIGQAFNGPKYFHGRPSAAGKDGYDATASGASNLGPTNPELIKDIEARAVQVRLENGLAPGATVPADLVTSSASGLDPDISPESAYIQVQRVARERNLPEKVILAIVKAHIKKRQLGVLGEDRVNVLELNMALDEITS